MLKDDIMRADSINKEIYHREEKGFSTIFHQPWWLNIVCKKATWNTSLVKNKEGKTIGILAYYLTSYLGFKIIRTPPFTPYLGVWLDYSQCSDKNAKLYSFEEKVINQLIDQLPKVIWYHQIHFDQLQNWLPFYWRGYKQTTRYTYVFEQLDLSLIYSKFREDVRNKIRKAELTGVSIIAEDNLPEFLQVYKKTFERQKMGIRDLSILEKLHNEIHKREQGTIYFAKDKAGNTHAGLYLVWDEETAYCWLLGADTKLRHSGAVQLLIWHSIQAASKIVKRYNFEGSMLPHIEPVFRAFGAERKPVFQIRKFGNRFIEALWVLFGR